MEFEWDDNKADANLDKHGVSFEEAKTSFNDPLYIDFFDPDHSDEEERYILVGQSERLRHVRKNNQEKHCLTCLEPKRSRKFQLHD